jgi:tetrahydromethanopterin S-methyltransferase subunit H
MGFPIGFIADTMNKWADSVENRFQILAQAVQNSPEKTIELMKKAAAEARSQAVAHAPSGQQGGGSEDEIATLMKFAGMFGGGESSGLEKKITEAFIEQGLESMKMTANLGKAVMDSVVAKMAAGAGKAVTKALEEAPPT